MSDLNFQVNDTLTKNKDSGKSVLIINGGDRKAGRE